MSNDVDDDLVNYIRKSKSLKDKERESKDYKQSIENKESIVNNGIIENKESKENKEDKDNKETKENFEDKINSVNLELYKVEDEINNTDSVMIPVRERGFSDLIISQNKKLYEVKSKTLSLESIFQADDSSQSESINRSFSSRKSSESYHSIEEINNLIKLYETEDKIEKQKENSGPVSGLLSGNASNLGTGLFEEEVKLNFGKTESNNSLNFKKNKTVGLDDFKYVVNIGKGSYGKVDLYKKKNTGDFFAIKSVDYNLLVINIIKLLFT